MINPQTQGSYSDLENLSNMEKPIPGQSLTNNPEAPLPFEGPTVHTELAPAIDDLLVKLCEPEVFHGIVGALADGLPVGEMAEQILFEGFAQGQYNPDLMLLLVEPTMYILIALADMADIEPRIDDEDDEEDAEEQLSHIEQAIEKAKDAFVPSQIPVEIKSKVEKLTENIAPSSPSLLSKKE
jgi:predicted lipid-binding transport protein (Tim44 family)